MSEELRAAIEQFEEYIKGETLAVEFSLTRLPDSVPVDVKVAGHKVTLYVKVTKPS